VKLSAQIQLQPTPEQHLLLMEIMEVCNSACNEISEIAWENKIFNRIRLHHEVYYKIRTKYNLSAEATMLCITKVSDSYIVNKKSKHVFKIHGAITYDYHILNFKQETQTLSIRTLKERQRMSYLIGNHQRNLMQYKIGESKLCFGIIPSHTNKYIIC
jgi:putative transposase